MTHNQLWAPWRMACIDSSDGPATESCFLCRYRDQNAESDPDNFVVTRTEHSIVVLNRFPYNNGHLLVAPLSHIGSLTELSDDALTDSIRRVRWITALLGRLLTPDGFNVGLNLGRAAGAGLPGHLHWHVVPRWNGDTNFMPVLGEAKVISQSLEALYDMLVEEIAAEAK